MNRWYTGAWLLLGLLAAALEATALIDPGAGDTLTETLRPILNWHPAIWFASLGLAVWVIRHLWWKKP